MSAIFNNSTAKVFTATLTGTVPNSTGRVLVACWAKWDATALNSANTLMQYANTNVGGNPSAEMLVPATANVQFGPNGSSANSSGTFSSGTWFSAGGAYGPWDGASHARRNWLNGTLTTANVAATSASADMTFLAIGRRLTAASAWKGRIAQVGVWVGLTTGQEDTVMAAAQLYHVDTISIAPNFSWRLSSAVTAATGGIALTNTGTVAFDGADDPTLTAYSAAGSVWTSCCVV